MCLTKSERLLHGLNGCTAGCSFSSLLSPCFLLFMMVMIIVMVVVVVMMMMMMMTMMVATISTRGRKKAR